MRLESRVRKLETTMSAISHDDDLVGCYRDHVVYFLSLSGEVTVFDPEPLSTYDGTEEDFWAAHPPGTKFRCLGGGYVVCDGVKRYLNFPPDDGKISPETMEAVGWLLEEPGP